MIVFNCFLHAVRDESKLPSGSPSRAVTLVLMMTNQCILKTERKEQMTREQKYPETDTFHYHNENPHNRITGDCTYRAIARATGVPYDQVVRDGAELHIKTGFPVDTDQGIEKIMALYGWKKHPQPRKADRTKYTGKEFCKQIAVKKCRYFAKMANHAVAIVDGKVNDIWDSTDKTLGNYWTEE